MRSLLCLNSGMNLLKPDLYNLTPLTHLSSSCISTLRLTNLSAIPELFHKSGHHSLPSHTLQKGWELEAEGTIRPTATWVYGLGRISKNRNQPSGAIMQAQLSRQENIRGMPQPAKVDDISEHCRMFCHDEPTSTANSAQDVSAASQLEQRLR